ncbi:MAG: S28 family serine protease [Crocinitomicaceae bacterium]|nr:aminopeptidase [Crocinitomicaceae bacterium]
MSRVFLSLIFVFGIAFGAFSKEDSSELLERLKQIPQISKVKKIDVTDHFTEAYEFYFEQAIDPNDPESSKFLQRVVIGHIDFDSPVVFELEGYSIHSAESGELPTMFQCNQIAIEHRFFENALPENGEIPWEKLTIENAAFDHHQIIQSIKEKVYPKCKFIATGISKGGQTTMIHRSFYPNDVDVSVCYVAPLNFSREDPRIYKFLKSVGTKKQRDQIKDFQLRCLKAKKEILPIMKLWARENKLEWDFSLEMAFEYYVLEYSFAFWQWGFTKFSEIPDEKASAAELLSHVLDVTGVSFFEKHGVEELRPYFWAALTQEGIYGYEVDAFKDYLSQKTTYTFDFAFPQGHEKAFDPEPMRKLNQFIQEKATKIMFINGGLDTWGATGVKLTDKAKARGLKLYVNEKGHHATRIRHFDRKVKKEIIETLETWLGVEVKREP